jgi:UDP-N-acetylmuramate--alanine ligase
MHIPRTCRVHFVGIGGIGMSGIAEVLLNLNYHVSGSDIAASEVTTRLEKLGARIACGHAEGNLQEADVVVISSAIKPDNPEVLAARRRGVPVIPRAEMLAELMRLKRGVAVAGAHGKTTTTSLLGAVLARAGYDPTLVIGGRVNSLGSNARLGQGELLVAEADESDGSFLKLRPTYAVITNIDPEHLDHFGTVERIKDAFVQFANQVPFYGLVAACLDDPNVREVLPRIEKRVVTYGIAAPADYRAEQITFGSAEVSFDLLRRSESVGRLCVKMIGRHNVQNALGVMAIADEIGVSFADVKGAFADFQGVERRFTIRGEVNGITVVDDYGHHPTEIKATLEAACQALGRRLVVVFQPHRFTRTRDLEKEFFTAFDHADQVVVMDIYAASEKPIPNVSGYRLFAGIRDHGHPSACFIPDRSNVVNWLIENTRPGDLIVTQGAGDVWKVGKEFLERCSQGNNKQPGGAV